MGVAWGAGATLPALRATLPTVVPADSRPLSWPPIGALPRNRLASSATGSASAISPYAGEALELRIATASVRTGLAMTWGRKGGFLVLGKKIQPRVGLGWFVFGYKKWPPGERGQS